MSKLIQIDGLDGGGQMLRTALSLAMITGRPFRITRIRGARAKPGLMRQHLTCVKAACEISGGSADGAEIGSTELVFRSGKVRGGSYHFAIGTAGSTSLLLQTLLPALLRAGAPSTLRLEGGTHNPQAPPFDFLDRVFLHTLRRMGAEVRADLISAGFAPAGGGVIECSIQPCERLQALHLTERGDIGETHIRVLLRQLPRSIAERIIAAAKELFPEAPASIEELAAGVNPGIHCLVETCFPNGGIEIASGFGGQNITAERVGIQAAKSMHRFLSCGAPVGRHLGDQLLLPFALAGGGSFITQSPDSHLDTNIAVIEKFLPVRFTVTPADHGARHVSVG